VDVDAEYRTLVSALQVLSECSLSDLSIANMLRSILVHAHGTQRAASRSLMRHRFMEAKMGRGLLLWLLGVPIPIIILLWLFFGR
jgi:hypothetical protein